MNNWLKMQIAEKNDIAANCVFVSPNEIIQKIYYFLGGPYPNIFLRGKLQLAVCIQFSEKQNSSRISLPSLLTIRMPDMIKT